MGHICSANEVILWKTSNVDLGNDRYMFVVYYYHTDKNDKTKTFYKCNIRIDSKDNWEKMRDELLNLNPAENFRTSMIGLDDDYLIHYARHTFNKADMYKWIGTKFSPAKIKPLGKFLSEEFAPSVVSPYLRKYVINGTEVDISEIDKIPTGQWFSAYKEKKNRKSYGTIVK